MKCIENTCKHSWRKKISPTGNRTLTKGFKVPCADRYTIELSQVSHPLLFLKTGAGDSIRALKNGQRLDNKRSMHYCKRFKCNSVQLNKQIQIECESK